MPATLLSSHSHSKGDAMLIQRCTAESQPTRAGQQARLGQEEWPHQGHLQFCGVSLRYGRDLPDALDGVSFELKPGLKVGICGRTGQTLSHAYMRVIVRIRH